MMEIFTLVMVQVGLMNSEDMFNMVIVPMIWYLVLMQKKDFVSGVMK